MDPFQFSSEACKHISFPITSDDEEELWENMLRDVTGAPNMGESVYTNEEHNVWPDLEKFLENFGEPMDEVQDDHEIYNSPIGNEDEIEHMLSEYINSIPRPCKGECVEQVNAEMPCFQQGSGQDSSTEPGPSGLGKRICSRPTTNSKAKQKCLQIATDENTPIWRIADYDDISDEEDDDYADVVLSHGKDTLRHFYQLRPISKRYVKKFDMEREDHEARFRNMREISPEEFPVRVHQILTSIFSDIFDGSDREGKIRVCMDADDLHHAYNAPFVNVEDFNPMRVIDAIAKILNSNQKLVLEGGEIRINVIQVRLPQKGSGKKERHFNNRITIDPHVWAQSKLSLITIKNNDELCLARALVVAIASIKKQLAPNDMQLKARYKQIADSRRPVQKCEAEKIHKYSNIPLGPCGIAEIQKFQEYLENEYQILVYSADAKNSRIFTGPKKPGTQRIALFLLDNHYYVITSLTGFHGASYVCDECLAPTRDKKYHKCKAVCYSCKSSMCNPKEKEAHLLCDNCNRYFFNVMCLNNHIQNGTCDTVIRCHICKRTGHRGPHEHCFKKLCYVCKCYVDYDHLCYMQMKDYSFVNSPIPLNSIDMEMESSPQPLSSLPIATECPRYYFYDFECTQETGTHIPNLVICKGEDDLNLKFYGPTSRDDFCDWIFKHNCGLPQDQTEKIFIAHYAKAYDSFLILDYLHRNKLYITPVKTGLKLLSLDIPRFHCKFLDSHSFIPMALAKFPSTFGLKQLKKGYFPHFFNTIDNQNYFGPLPEPHFYGVDTMTVQNRDNFLKWYHDELETYRTNPEKMFNLKQELIDYCDSDVQILKDSCIAFRNEFLDTTSIDPFGSITIASACHKVFRTHFLKPETIAIIPQQGYIGRKKQQSKKALEWMAWLSHKLGIDIINANSLQGEAKIGNCYVDGLCSERKSIFEFYGCYFHGCHKCYKPHEVNKHKAQTMANLHATTLDREKHLTDIKPDYDLITIWECDYDEILKTDEEMTAFVEAIALPDQLNPRDAFYGGRTHTSRLYAIANEGEIIRYYDFVSLYPTVNKFGKMPIGHPELVFPKTYIKNEYFGLIKATILPPKKLYHPVLPYRARGKLLFPLCKTCSEINNQAACIHNNQEREITGTWCTPEVDVALEEGYQIVNIQAIWHFNKYAEYGSTEEYPQGLFGEYVDLFLKIKQESSGWPTWVKTEEDKDEFISSYFDKEKVQLDKPNIKHNPGRRALAKLCLNSFWGRFGMREDLPTTEYVSDYDRFLELLTSSKYITTDANLVNDEMVLITFKTDKDCIIGSPFTNVVIAAFTTTLARLKLYELLKILGKDALYMDTDSVIYVSQKDNDPLRNYLGENLGMMTDEIVEEHGNGAYIEEFVSGGPKNYGYRVSNGVTVFKVRGIMQNFKNCDKVNFKVMLELIQGFVNDGDKTQIVLEETKIKRNMVEATLKNNKSTHTYKIVYDKAVVGPDFIAYPFGY